MYGIILVSRVAHNELRNRLTNCQDFLMCFADVPKKEDS